MVNTALAINQIDLLVLGRQSASLTYQWDKLYSVARRKSLGVPVNDESKLTAAINENTDNLHGTDSIDEQYYAEQQECLQS